MFELTCNRWIVEQIFGKFTKTQTYKDREPEFETNRHERERTETLRNKFILWGNTFISSLLRGYGNKKAQNKSLLVFPSYLEKTNKTNTLNMQMIFRNDSFYHRL